MKASGYEVVPTRPYVNNPPAVLAAHVRSRWGVRGELPHRDPCGDVPFKARVHPA